MDEYTVAKLEDGQFEIRQHGEEEPISIDADNKRFCEFMNWFNSCETHQTHVEFKAPVGSEFYCMETETILIKCFQEKGRMLFCKSVPDQDDKMIVETWNSKTFKDISSSRYFSLCIVSHEGPRRGRLFGVRQSKSTIWVSIELRDQLNKQLQDEDNPVRCMALWPVERAFVYVDISEFSKYRPGQQALVINSLGVISSKSSFPKSPHEHNCIQDCENVLCIGDGYIYCFKSPLYAAYFAARLAEKIEHQVANKNVIEFHFRIGVHFGSVFRFWDIGRGQFNYVGKGINGGNRVLSAIGKDMDDVVFVSNEVRDEIMRIPSKAFPRGEILDALQNRGRRADKHGKMWRVYELHHSVIQPR